MLDEMLNEILDDFLRSYTSIQLQLANIHGILVAFIDNFLRILIYDIYLQSQIENGG